MFPKPRFNKVFCYWCNNNRLLERGVIRNRFCTFSKLNFFEEEKQIALKKLENQTVSISYNSSIKEYPASFSALDLAKEVLTGKAMKNIICAKLGDNLIDLRMPLGLYKNLQHNNNNNNNNNNNDNIDGKQLSFVSAKQSEIQAEVLKRTSWHLLNYSLFSVFNNEINIANSDLDCTSSNKTESITDFNTISGATVDSKILESTASAIQNNISQKLLNQVEILPVPIRSLKNAFKNNTYKNLQLEKYKNDEQFLLVIRIKDYVSITSGPLLLHPEHLFDVHITSNSAVHWMEKKDKTLQRLTSIGFANKKDSQKYHILEKEKKERDHRLLGEKMKLFMIHKYCSGSPIFLPRGKRMFNNLQNLLRKEYLKYDFEEVDTPNMFSKELWETSGHWQMYQNDMFLIKNDDNNAEPDTGIKPMNCPAHCLIYNNELRSFRELPFRIADFGSLHRNEISGALTGLTRVRRFHQDDAHIFCTPEQILQEIESCLKMLDTLYKKFGFDFQMALSTRPKNSIGSDEEWNNSESQLRNFLDSHEKEYIICEGDGAFYGPKIDIYVTDSYGRTHQTATIQLDFQLPQRFDLTYIDEQGQKCRPVMIHRAVLGSFERMMALLIEHWKGRFPLWLSPCQVLVSPVSHESLKQVEFVKALTRKLKMHNYHVDLDLSNEALKKKIARSRQLYNYIAIIGDSEIESNSVSVRPREDNYGKVYKIDDFIEKLNSEL